MSSIEQAGLYVHVPFCRTKCPYCDFYSVTDLSLVSRWLEGLQKEVSYYKDRFDTFDTIYLGGGTPTLLEERDLTVLMDSLFQSFSFSPDTEITIEANPDDISLEKLLSFRDMGINRISLGAQSFNDDELRFLQRRHTARQAEKSLELIRASGFENVGIDLINGLPEQTESAWIKTINRALDFRPEHLSCYQMTIEKRTPFGKMSAAGNLKPIDVNRERELFLFTSRFLKENGYIHYEISNYAKDLEHCSRHNLKYWKHNSYLGLGPAAHSFQGSKRWWNAKSIESYCRTLDERRLPVAGTESLSAEQHQLEMLFLGFRTREGIDYEIIQGKPQWRKVISQLDTSGLITIRDGRVVSTLQGFLVADSLSLLFQD